MHWSCLCVLMCIVVSGADKRRTRLVYSLAVHSLFLRRRRVVSRDLHEGRTNSSPIVWILLADLLRRSSLCNSAVFWRGTIVICNWLRSRWSGWIFFILCADCVASRDVQSTAIYWTVLFLSPCVYANADYIYCFKIRCCIWSAFNSWQYYADPTFCEACICRCWLCRLIVLLIDHNRFYHNLTVISLPIGISVVLAALRRRMCSSP